MKGVKGKGKGERRGGGRRWMELGGQWGGQWGVKKAEIQVGYSRDENRERCILEGGEWGHTFEDPHCSREIVDAAGGFQCSDAN